MAGLFGVFGRAVSLRRLLPMLVAELVEISTEVWREEGSLEVMVS